MADYIPSFPGELPLPLVSQYQYQHADNLQSTEMRNGRVRVRELYKNVPSTISMKFRFTDRQLRLFEGFLRFEANSGATKFTLPLRLPRSESVEEVTVHLTQPYSGPTWVENAKNSQGYWDVNLTATTIDDIRTSESEYWSFVAGMTAAEARELLAPGINTYWAPDYPYDTAQEGV